MNPHKTQIIEGLLKAPKRTIIVDVTSTIRDKTFTSPINVNRVLKEYDGLEVKITIELKEGGIRTSSNIDSAINNLLAHLDSHETEGDVSLIRSAISFLKKELKEGSG